jgi:hypothetical protein
VAPATLQSRTTAGCSLSSMFFKFGGIAMGELRQCMLVGDNLQQLTVGAAPARQCIGPSLACCGGELACGLCWGCAGVFLVCAEASSGAQDRTRVALRRAGSLGGFCFVTACSLHNVLGMQVCRCGPALLRSSVGALATACASVDGISGFSTVSHPTQPVRQADRVTLWLPCVGSLHVMWCARHSLYNHRPVASLRRQRGSARWLAWHAGFPRSFSQQQAVVGDCRWAVWLQPGHGQGRLVLGGCSSSQSSLAVACCTGFGRARVVAD